MAAKKPAAKKPPTIADLKKQHDKLRTTAAYKKASPARKAQMIHEVTVAWNKQQPKNYTVEDLAGKYQYSEAILRSVPELMKVFKDAYIAEWSEDKIIAAISNTSWFRDHSARWKEVEQMRTRVPGEYNAKLDEMRVELNGFANSIGAQLDAGELENLSREALYGGWSEGKMRQMLTTYIDIGANGGLTGEAGEAEMKLRQLAAANGVEYTDSWFRQNAVTSLAQNNLSSFEQQIRENAGSVYVQWADQIKSGANVNQLAGGHLKSLENMYDMQQGSASLFDPRVKKALQGKAEDGSPVVQPLWKFEEDLRRDPKWLTTKNANETMGQVSSGLLQEWGFLK